MPAFETLLIVGLAILLAAVAAATFVAMRGVRRGEAATALGEGRFAEALAAAGESGGAGGREELLAGAVAAKHLLDFERARELLARILEADPEDGEVGLERGLVAAYRGDAATAGDAFERAERLRADLIEPLTLHRAWLALARGDPETARRLFEEVEAPIENKLTTDLGAGDPIFAEWYFQAAALWEAAGQEGKARWSWETGRVSAPASRLPEVMARAGRAPNAP